MDAKINDVLQFLRQNKDVSWRETFADSIFLSFFVMYGQTQTQKKKKKPSEPRLHGESGTKLLKPCSVVIK